MGQQRRFSGGGRDGVEMADNFALRIMSALIVCALVFWPGEPVFAQQHGHTMEAMPPQLAENAPQATKPAAAGPAAGTRDSMHAQAVFTLRTGVAEGRLVFLGAGGAIDGQVNPMLKVHEGETVQINLVNGEGAQHDIVIDQYAVRSDMVVGKGASSSLSFTASKTGEFAYYCSVPGHRAAGMEGRVEVIPGPRAAAVATAPDIVRDPADLPPPIFTRPPQVVHVDLEAVELTGQLDDNTTYNYWTFNGKVPGPFIRVRVGDTVEVRLKNRGGNVMIHSVDFHAAIGPGGGAAFSQTGPGAEKTFTFKALVPGLFVYHCATPSVAVHITNGMYGMILVEPEGGLTQVDREFYIMQGELYTAQPFGATGNHEMDYEKLTSERPEYFVFNGAVGALTKTHPLRARVGETVRIFFGVGGPNFTSSFHVIGEIFERVYEGASLTSPPLTGVQTVTVPPGGATVVELKIVRAGKFTIVDHALSRLERGLAGFLIVEGPANNEIMHEGGVKK